MVDYITVEAIPAKTFELSHTFRGQLHHAVTSVTVDGNTAVLAADSWSAKTPLSVGENEIVILAYTADGLVYRATFTIAVVSTRPDLDRVWNVLDEWGQIMGVRRLPGERNRSFKLRLQDGANRPGGASMIRLVQGMSRALGIQYFPTGVSITPGRDQEHVLRAQDPWFSVSASFLQFSTASHVYSELRRVSGNHSALQLRDEYPLFDDSSIRVLRRSGDEVPATEWVYDEDRNEVRFHRQSWRLEYLTLIHRYQVEIGILSRTLGELIAAVQGYVAGGGPVLTIATTLPSTFAARGLSSVPWTSLTDVDSVDLLWSELSLRELIDEDFRELWFEDGHAYQTQVESWARRAQRAANLGWQNAVLDKSSWEEEPLSAGLPHLFDAEHTYWQSPNGSVLNPSHRYFLGDKELNGLKLDRHGPSSLDWTAGIAGVDSLAVADAVVRSD